MIYYQPNHFLVYGSHIYVTHMCFMHMSSYVSMHNHDSYPIFITHMFAIYMILIYKHAGIWSYTWLIYETEHVCHIYEFVLLYDTHIWVSCIWPSHMSITKSSYTCYTCDVPERLRRIIIKIRIKNNSKIMIFMLSRSDLTGIGEILIQLEFNLGFFEINLIFFNV